MWQVNKRLVVYILLLTFSLILMIYLGTRGGNDTEEKEIKLPRDYPEIRLEGKLRILSPYNAIDYKTDEKGDITGRAFDLAKKISNYTDAEVEIIIENDPTKALEMLRLGEVDLVTLPILRTSHIDTTTFALIQEQISKPLYLVQRDDSLKISRQTELGDKTIRLAKGSEYGLFIHHLAEDIGDSIHLEYDPIYSTEQLIIQVSLGKLGYTVCSAEEAKAYPKKLKGIDCSLPLSYSLRQAWMIRRSSPILRDSIQAWVLR